MKIYRLEWFEAISPFDGKYLQEYYKCPIAAATRLSQLERDYQVDVTIETIHVFE